MDVDLNETYQFMCEGNQLVGLNALRTAFVTHAKMFVVMKEPQKLNELVDQYKILENQIMNEVGVEIT